MNKRVLGISFLAWVSVGCTTSMTSEEQTVRVGDVQVKLQAPQWVWNRKLYPLKVTYTNVGDAPVEMMDPSQCPYIWQVEDASTGIVPQPERAVGYGCTTEFRAPILLGPGESLRVTKKAIVDGFPKGEYRIPAEVLPVHSEYRSPTKPLPMQPRVEEVHPKPQEVRFELR